MAIFFFLFWAFCYFCQHGKSLLASLGQKAAETVSSSIDVALMCETSQSVKKKFEIHQLHVTDKSLEGQTLFTKRHEYWQRRLFFFQVRSPKIEIGIFRYTTKCKSSEINSEIGYFDWPKTRLMTLYCSQITLKRKTFFKQSLANKPWEMYVRSTRICNSMYRKGFNETLTWYVIHLPPSGPGIRLGAETWLPFQATDSAGSLPEKYATEKPLDLKIKI